MEAFRRVLPDLLKEHAGQWVVFFDGKVINFYEDEAAACEAAIGHFGPNPGFIVAQVESEQPQPISSALLF